MKHELQPATRIGGPRAVVAPREALFRAEALEEQRTLWLGRHTLALGLPTAMSSLASAALVLAAASLLAYGNYARRVELHGVVLPSSGLIQVAAPASGWVEALDVHDRERVARGTLLYTLNTDIATRKGDTQQQILRSLAAQRSVLLFQIRRKTEIRDQQDAELRSKIDNLAAQIEQMNVQITVKYAFVRQLTKDFAAYVGYLARGIGNRNEKETQQQNWMRSRDELEELKSAALRLRGQQIATRASLGTLHLQSDNEIDGMRAQLSSLDEQVANAEARHAIEIVSPGPGTVTAIAIHPGQEVPSGVRMLTIVPSHERMQADLLAPSTSIGFIHPRQRVLLRYSAFPYQKFGEYWGTILEISRVALQPDELKAIVPAFAAADRSKTFYRVIVAPDRAEVTAYGRAEPLEPSMQVDARVLLERRPLYQWILEPLYGLRGRPARVATGHSA